MPDVKCAVCGAAFSGRSDAQYCSSACRQKAHRTRTANRTAAMTEQLAHRPVPAIAGPASADARFQHVHESIRRSRELCARSAQACRQSSALIRQLSAKQIELAYHDPIAR